MIDFQLDPKVAFLNHGSFGAVPRAITEARDELLLRLERQPVDFFLRYLPDAMKAVREKVGAFANADPDGLAFVPNATSGVNTIVKSLDIGPDDELLTTNMAYGACRFSLDFVAAKTGARVVTARVPFPIENEDQIFEAVVGAVTSRTKLAMLDHIASPTGLIFPIARLVAALDDMGIDTVVDGAHVIGQIPLDLTAIGAAYYTTNAHKWLCSPRGAALLYVRDDRRALVDPLVTSWGYNAEPDKRFRAQFDWMGTDDPTAHLVIPAAIDHLGSALEGGWPALYAAIHDRVIAGRRTITKTTGFDIPSPDDLHGALAPILLLPGEPRSGDGPGSMNDILWRDHEIEVPVFPWPTPDARCLRLSAHLYTKDADFERLARALLPEG